METVTDSELIELNFLLEELQKRQAHSSITYIPDDQPGRNQLGFHQSNKWCRLIFGGNRSGKSRSAAQEIYWWFNQNHPFIKTPKSPRIWVLSAEYRTIYEGIWTHLKNVIPPWDIAKIGPKIPGWDIPSYIESKQGSRIDFISAQGGEETRRKVQAAEIDLLEVDEEISGDLWEELQMRLLTRGGKVIISATLIQSEEWLLDLEQENKDNPIDGMVDLFRLDTRLNKYNDPVLLKRIISKLSPDEQQVRIFGQSRRTSGLIYSDWSPDHEIDPFPIPKHWTRAMCFDPGYRVAAALWVAVNENGESFGYREMYETFAQLHTTVNIFRASEGYVLNDSKVWIQNPLRDFIEPISLRLIDPAAFRMLEDGSAGVGYQLANDYELFFTPANNDKATNIEDARSWLLTNALGNPKFRIFKTLTNFLTERRKYRLKPNRTKRDQDSSPDRPIKKHDHLMNCFEYLATARISFQGERSYADRLTDMARMDNDEIEWPNDSRMLRVQLAKKRRELVRNENDGFD